MKFAVDEPIAESTIAVIEDLSDVPLEEITSSDLAEQVLDRLIHSSSDSSFGTSGFNSFVGTRADRSPRR
jgi:hypothetical protein